MYTDLITINDFKRELRLSLTGQNIEDLNDYIEEVAKNTMADLLGDELSDFETEIVKETPEAKWITLWAKAKLACVYFIYSEYMNFVGTMKKNGLYKDVISNAEQTDSIQYRNQITIAYNKGVSYYNDSIYILINGDYKAQSKHKEQKCII